METYIKIAVTCRIRLSFWWAFR